MLDETVQSEELYMRVAERYESVFERAVLAEGRLTLLVRHHMNGKRVLDLACGNGRWLNRFRPSEYVGLDLNEKMLEQARTNHPHVTFVRGDMRDIPFGNESFEGVVSLFGSMGHLPHEGQEEMVREVRRVLVEDGTAIFSTGNKWSPFNLPMTLKGNRFRLEGVRLRVHSSTPRRFLKLLGEYFSVERLESYDYSYAPLMPVKLGACLVNRDYRQAYSWLMDVFDHCTYIPDLRWFGKQLLAVCRKS